MFAVKSSPSFWLAAAAVLVLSLAPKAVLGVLRARTAPTTTPSEKLRAFLVASSDGAVEPIRENNAARDLVGWRFVSRGCAAQAFTSGRPGNLDFPAHEHAAKGARLVYFYRGTVSDRPPAWRLAIDVMVFRMFAEFTPSRAHEPGYVILVYPPGCAGPRSLPWGPFRSD